MPDIPSSEPTRMHAGATTQWTKSISDYPAPTYTLKYYLTGPADLTIAGAQYGTSTDHLVSVSATQSAAWIFGKYTWQSYAEKGSGDTLERYYLGAGSVQIDTVTGKSDARVIYDDLIAKYKSLASTGMQVQSYSISGLAMTYTKPQDMLDAIKYWAGVVRDEEDALVVESGGRNPRHVGGRFRRL